MYALALKLIFVFENLENHERSVGEGSTIHHSVLIFLPGINEIDRMDKKIDQFKKADDTRQVFKRLSGRRRNYFQLSVTTFTHFYVVR